jgi:hypothetical protein
MPKKIHPENPVEIPIPGTSPEIKPGDPDYPDFPEKEPDIIPAEDPRESPSPYEIPPSRDTADYISRHYKFSCHIFYYGFPG